MKYIYRAYDANGNLQAEGNTAFEIAQISNTNANKVYKSIETNDFVETRKWSDVYMKFTREEVDTPISIEDESPIIIEDLPDEIWKPLPGYLGYYISNKERAKYVNGDGNERLCSLIISTNKTGRHYKHINISGKSYVYSRAVWRAFKDTDFPLEYHGKKFYEAHPDVDKTKDPYYNVIVDHKPEYKRKKDLTDMPHKLNAITQSKNIRKAIKSGKNIGIAPKRAYARRGDEYYEFDTTIDCVRFCVKDRNEKPNSGRFNNAIKSSRKNPEAGYIGEWKVGYAE